jgi:hemolysin D
METKTETSTEAGLLVLQMLLRLRHLAVDPEELRRRIGKDAVDVPEMVACARALGFKAWSRKAKWRRLLKLPLPAIAGLKDGDFLLLGKAVDDRIIVVSPHASRPMLLTREEFEAKWDGRLVLMVPRGALDARLRRWGGACAAAPSQLLRRMRRGVRRIARPEVAKEAAQLGVNVAGAAIIDFTERARKLRRAIDPNDPAEGRRNADELAFLPAALEIVETPPSPVGRAVGFSLIAVFVVALAWASLGTVDIVAVAQGKVIPSGRTKTIQPFETGIVRAIHVNDGQSVKAGDVLMELDPTMNAAELGRLSSDLMAAKLDVARLKAALSGKPDPREVFVPPEGAPEDMVRMHRRFLLSQSVEHTAKLASIDRQIAQKEAERATIKASIDKLKATSAPLQQRVEIREHLLQKELSSKVQYLAELQELVGQRQDILVQESRYGETDAAIGTLVETRAQAVAEYERTLFDELSRAEQRVAGLLQDVVKAEQRTSLQRLTAPVDGMVQQLAVHTVGGVVTPAQPLMLIVPAESRLEVEAMIPNRDIGFVEVGQEAAIKIDTFNFTRYGLLHGRILTLSQDAIANERPAKAASNGEPTSEPKGQELVYSARISLDRTQMEVETKRVNLSPGMAVTVEIKTGSRRIISYLLSPLMRYRHDSLRER